nr:transposase [[Clostridium] symbiosum]
MISARWKRIVSSRGNLMTGLRMRRACGIKKFEACAKTYRAWRKEILNAFKYGLTNGPTEGFNNKIKVLKRSSYGIRNFKRFRTRILHCTS